MTHMKGLDIFEAFGDIRTDYIAAAAVDPVLLAAPAVGDESHRRVRRAPGRFFHSTAWVAILCTVVSLGIVIAIVRAGRSGPTVQPPGGNPNVEAANLPEAQAEEADYTILTEQSRYPLGTDRIRVVITGREAGKTIYPVNSWRVEKIEGKPDDEGGNMFYPAFAWAEVRADDGGYASTSTTLNFSNPDGMKPGRYRLYNMNYDGTYVTYCEFELYDPEVSETIETVATEADAPYELIAMNGGRYAIGTPRMGVIIRSTKAGEIMYPSNMWRIEKISGGEDPEEAQITMKEVFIAEVHPTDGEQYACADWFFYLMNPDSFTPGVWRVYILSAPEYKEDWREHVISYCDIELYEEETAVTAKA